MAQPKQQILDRRIALDEQISDARSRKLHGLLPRVVRGQAAARQQLQADCEVNAGHVFQPGGTACLLCAAPVDAAQRLLVCNLTRSTQYPAPHPLLVSSSLGAASGPPA